MLKLRRGRGGRRVRLQVIAFLCGLGVLCAGSAYQAGAQEYETDAAEEEAAPPPAPAPVAPAPPARHEPAPGTALPTYLSLHPDIHAFRAFADGGWDGNWYVGFNTCWIVKLPKVPAGNYARAYIGERLGRAKTRPRIGGATWDKEPVPGKIYMAISTFPAFSPMQSFFLAATSDIPQEPDYENPNLEVGHGEWFWAEIPVRMLNFDGPNYLSTWSNTDTLVTASSSPILGAAMERGPKDTPRAWLNSGIAGVPPRDQTSAIGVPVSFYLPSLAIKLVPHNTPPLGVKGFTVSQSTAADAIDARFVLNGQDPELAWVEASPDGMGWERVTPYSRHAPHFFSIPAARLGRPYSLSGAVYLRAVGQDALGTQGLSEILQLPFPAPR